MLHERTYCLEKLKNISDFYLFCLLLQYLSFQVHRRKKVVVPLAVYILKIYFPKDDKMRLKLAICYIRIFILTLTCCMFNTSGEYLFCSTCKSKCYVSCIIKCCTHFACAFIYLLQMTFLSISFSFLRVN